MGTTSPNFIPMSVMGPSILQINPFKLPSFNNCFRIFSNLTQMKVTNRQKSSSIVYFWESWCLILLSVSFCVPKRNGTMFEWFHIWNTSGLEILHVDKANIMYKRCSIWTLLEKWAIVCLTQPTLLNNTVTPCSFLLRGFGTHWWFN